MALWQFIMWGIPRRSILEKEGQMPERLFIDKKGWKKYYEVDKRMDPNAKPKFEDALTINWWNEIQIDVIDFVEKVDMVLSETNREIFKNSIGWKIYVRNLRDHDASILVDMENGTLAKFMFRIDLRDSELKYFKGMLQICQEYDLIIMGGDGRLAKPKLDEVVKIIRDSNTHKFLKNPIEFFEKINLND